MESYASPEYLVTNEDSNTSSVKPYDQTESKSLLHSFEGDSGDHSRMSEDLCGNSDDDSGYLPTTDEVDYESFTVKKFQSNL